VICSGISRDRDTERDRSRQRDRQRDRQRETDRERQTAAAYLPAVSHVLTCDL
jgi:hypothetical protein